MSNAGSMVRSSISAVRPDRLTVQEFVSLVAAEMSIKENDAGRILEQMSLEGYVAVKCPKDPVALVQIVQQYRDLFFGDDEPWFMHEPFATCPTELPGWLFVRPETVPESRSLAFGEQLARLRDGERVPDVVELAWTLVSSYVEWGYRLFQVDQVRTGTLLASGSRVAIGGFDHFGIEVSLWRDDTSKEFLGIGAARSLVR